MRKLGFGSKLFLFEAALGLAGVALAVLLGFWPNPRWWGPEAPLYAAAGTVPVVFFAWLVTTSRASKLKPFREISGLFGDSAVGGFIKSSGSWTFAAISLCAGVVEETLFRGILQ
ncbi:MAG TPA: hypothetical protein VFV50_07900, partial [Bdellovibrionales bacterium]|nr:hypothetical protein [Bdellovibrionales bacterium]